MFPPVVPPLVWPKKKHKQTDDVCVRDTYKILYLTLMFLLCFNVYAYIYIMYRFIKQYGLGHVYSNCRLVKETHLP